MDSSLNQTTIEKTSTSKDKTSTSKDKTCKVDEKKLSNEQKLQLAFDEADKFDETLKGTTITFGNIEYKR